MLLTGLAVDEVQAAQLHTDGVLCHMIAGMLSSGPFVCETTLLVACAMQKRNLSSKYFPIEQNPCWFLMQSSLRSGRTVRRHVAYRIRCPKLL